MNCTPTSAELIQALLIEQEKVRKLREALGAIVEQVEGDPGFSAGLIEDAQHAFAFAKDPTPFYGPDLPANVKALITGA